MFFACFAPAALLGLCNVPVAPESTLNPLHREDSINTESSKGSVDCATTPSAATASTIINNLRSNAWSVTKSIQRYQHALSMNLKFRLQLSEHFSVTNMRHTGPQPVDKTEEFGNEIERKNSLNVGGRFSMMSLENG